MTRLENEYERLESRRECRPRQVQADGGRNVSIHLEVNVQVQKNWQTCGRCEDEEHKHLTERRGMTCT